MRTAPQSIVRRLLTLTSVVVVTAGLLPMSAAATAEPAAATAGPGGMDRPIVISATAALDGVEPGRPAIVPFISPADIAALSGLGADGQVEANAAPEQPPVAEFTPGRTDLVSVATDGTPADGNSSFSAVSADGRYVAFLSDASNLVPGDTNGLIDVFVRDRVAGTTEMVSVASDGSIARGGSFGVGWAPVISADGRYVAFMTDADNLVPGDTNQQFDVFVHDRLTHTTDRVSVAGDGSEANGLSSHPAISADGRYVVFWTFADDLLGPGTNSASQVVVRDRVAGTTTLVSQSTSGQPSDFGSQLPNVSSDGRFITFHSYSTNLVAGYTPSFWGAVYIRDTVAGTTERVTFAADGGEPNDQFSLLYQPAVSDDGRFVAFMSRATNLVPGKANRVGDPLACCWDVFVRDMALGRTERVSVAGDGTEGNGTSGAAFGQSMSADGRYVVFGSNASNFVAGDANNQPDLFAHDRMSGATALLSRNSAGDQANSWATASAVSADGRHVAFSSFASNLAPGTNDDRSHVFARDLGPAIGAGGVAMQRSANGVDVSGWVNIEGGPIASATAVAGDAPDGGATGSDLIGASVAYRPETADLLFSWQVESLPSVAAPATPRTVPVVLAAQGGIPSVAVPAVAYVFTFQTKGFQGATDTWQVRASGTSATPRFELFHCLSGTCSRRATLTGGIGTTGHEVRVRLPIAAFLFNTSAGDALQAINAYDVPLAADVPSQLDSIDLGDVLIPEPTLTLGWGPAQASVDGIEFRYPARIVGSRFEATIDAPPGPGDRLWIRACLGADCVARSHAAPEGVVAGAG